MLHANDGPIEMTKTFEIQKLIAFSTKMHKQSIYNCIRLVILSLIIPFLYIFYKQVAQDKYENLETLDR